MARCTCTVAPTTSGHPLEIQHDAYHHQIQSRLPKAITTTWNEIEFETQPWKLYMAYHPKPGTTTFFQPRPPDGQQLRPWTRLRPSFLLSKPPYTRSSDGGERDRYPRPLQTRFAYFKRLPPSPPCSDQPPAIFPRYFVHYSIFQQSPDPFGLIDHQRYPNFLSLMNLELHSNPFTKNLDLSFKIHILLQRFNVCSWIYNLKCLVFLLFKFYSVILIFQNNIQI